MARFPLALKASPEAFMIYGRRPVEMALQAEPQSIERLWITDEAAKDLRDVVLRATKSGIAVTKTSRKELDHLTQRGNHQGIAAQTKGFSYTELSVLLEPRESPGLLVALDQVQDPHNVGAIIRNASVLGAHGLILTKDRGCEVTPTVVKASAGATSDLAIARVTNLVRALEQAKEAGYWILGTDIEAGQTLWQADLKQPVVIVVGSEGEGMRRLVREACDILVNIPTVGKVGSLNASVAAGVVLYESMRQRSATAASTPRRPAPSPG